MAETKRNLVKNLQKFMIFGHGGYSTNPTKFVVPENKVFIFVSKSSRYLPSRFVDEGFYRYFKTFRGPLPEVLQGWKRRIYGPGDVCSDIQLSFSDPTWRGMGIHSLPLTRNDQLMTTPGALANGTGTLSTINSPPGVYFVLCCRAINGQPLWYSNQRRNYNFSPNSVHRRLLQENASSSRMNKRRRETAKFSPRKRRKINTSLQ